MRTRFESRRPTAIGLSSTLDRLGTRRETLPMLDDLAHVLVVGDVSRSLSGEVIEARRISRIARVALAGNFQIAELVAKTAGGLVVEDIYLETTTTGGGIDFIPFVSFNLGPIGIGLVGPDLAADIGGVPGLCEIREGSDIVPPTPPGAQTFTVPTPNREADPNFAGPGVRWFGQAPFRIFVPAGSSLVMNGGFGQYLVVQLVWREMVDAQGEPG